MPRQVLIVDDDRDIRNLLTDQLAEIGFLSTSVADGEKALLLLNSRRLFDLIFLDLNMPKINGLSLVRALRHGNLPSKNTPVCMLTGSCDIQIIKRAAEFGATEFLLKPWTMNDLAQKVKLTLPKPQLALPDIKKLLTFLHVEEKNLFTATELSSFSDSTHKPFLVNLGEKRLCFIIRKGIKPASIAALPEADVAQWVTIFFKHGSKWQHCWPDPSINEATNKNLSNKKVS